MTTLIAVIGAASSLLLGTGMAGGSELAEVGGVIVDQSTGEVPPAPLKVEARLYTDDACAAATFADIDGRYSFVVPPGQYWLQVLLGEEEVLSEPVWLTEGSWVRNLRVPLGPADGASISRRSGSDPPATLTTGVSERVMRVLRDLAKALPPAPYFST